ncbi:MULTISPECIES: bifunctional 4-hydroxy-2-oxoglutarate aldolase/2-dehydro-3-deoxy-phosphogluconate aldolase [Terrabacteria group]|uniref:bifunctional 4-hydroxy-2-oxoglutarate aldolase/2-dehydro-3-deoxy-phosphogluconate aldolase n=1 Tax=Bacillati TaxID=1783272 RepID=UPI001C6E8EF7|nr:MULTISPECIES: bifunctional 4-hydroxy-2-oxoglutarate aldolase/2-dehydro-3-deoxy-phosphogluconate aldolase [Terrabacteria group]MBW9212331.1 bifunctional 4-hydroxy-2-oxoglutarate aldolase/2-dehydro-3-deoxy-phosphogluconate aldolase [Trueperella sp. zg.1013]
MNDLYERISQIGIVPVVKIFEAEDALPLAKALCNGGIDVAEITFRSEHAVSAIQQIHSELPNMLLGAGTVLTIEQAKQAKEAGASFIVTPGLNPAIVKWCLEQEIPILPGVSTASEIEQALSLGLKTLKFFPAESSGGAKKLKDFSGPYQNVQFLPTGGINATNMHDYLQLSNVIAIGGSFMLEKDSVQAKDWETIQNLAAKAIKSLLDYQLIHIGINSNSPEDSEKVCKLLCQLFHFTYYKKPKSNFAGVGFEVLHGQGHGKNGHIGIYTPYPEKALYQLKKMGVHAIEETITRNKKSHRINFAYLDLEIGGFGVHIINPDVKMEV